MKNLAISRQRFMSPVPFEKTGLNPRATAELRLKSFSITLKRESCAIKLFQKELVFGQFQNKWSKCSGSSSQKLHLLESFVPILFKKVYGCYPPVHEFKMKSGELRAFCVFKGTGKDTSPLNWLIFGNVTVFKPFFLTCLWSD